MAGVLAALLQPVLNLLSGSDVLNLRTLIVAVLSGVVAAVAVWATGNADSAPAPKVAAPTAATGGVTAPTQTATPEEFPGQTVPGE